MNSNELEPYIKMTQARCFNGGVEFRILLPIIRKAHPVHQNFLLNVDSSEHLKKLVNFINFLDLTKQAVMDLKM